MDNLYRLADFLSAVRWAELPPAVRAAAARCVLDTAAVAAGACGEPLLKQVEQTLTRFSGEDGKVCLWGRRRKTDLHTAVLSNAIAAHTLELDDVHTGSKTHIGSVAIPAAWGLAEALGENGEALLLSVVCAYETAARIGMALGVSSHRNRGWHATGTAGVFGAAAACAKLLGLDAAQTVSALGMAGTQASGLWSFLLDGASCKALHAGRAAVSGLDAALLSFAGMRGSGHVLEAADGGLLAAMSDEPDLSAVDRELGVTWEILRLDNKPYPCCRSAHCAIDAALALRKDCIGRLDQIREIRVDTYLVGHKQCGMSAGSLAPASVAEAKFSTPYTVAAALTDGVVSFAQFTPERIGDPALRALMEKVRVHTDPDFTAAYPGHWGCRLTIALDGGTALTEAVTDASGSLSRPLSEAQLLAKAEGLLIAPYGAGAREKAQALLDLAHAPSLPAL